MNALRYHESMQRGSPDFPLDYHHIDHLHPRYEMPYHWHEEFEILHVLKGSFALAIDDSSYLLAAGDVAFIAAGSLHGGTPSDCVYECVVFDMRLLLKANEFCKAYVSDIWHRRVSVTPLFLAGCKETKHTVLTMFEALRKRCEGYPLITFGCLLRFVGEIYHYGSYVRHATPQSSEAKNVLKLKTVFELIETQYHEPLNLGELASVVAMSPKYFCRFFKETTHRTPMDYVNYYRIEQACYQMDATDHNVTEVALDVGFGDLNYFIRAFKKYKGITPGQYLRQIRPKEV
ncbi:MAG: AraC family transcriptional regulator [Clostridia bacterium]